MARKISKNNHLTDIMPSSIILQSLGNSLQLFSLGFDDDGFFKLFISKLAL